MFIIQGSLGVEQNTLPLRTLERERESQSQRFLRGREVSRAIFSKGLMDLMELDKLSEVQLLVQKSVTTDLKKVALIDEIINLKREREREERESISSYFQLGKYIY